MSDIVLKVTVEEANSILEGLGQQPFAKVYALIAKIQQQAKAQLAGAGSQAASSQAARPADQDEKGGPEQHAEQPVRATPMALVEGGSRE